MTVKVAVLRLADVVAGSPQGRAAEERLQARIKELTAEREEQKRAALKAEAEARRLPDPRVAEERALEADRLRRRADLSHQEGEIEIDAMRRQLLHDVLAEVEPLVRVYSEENGIDLVQLAPNPGLAYFNPQLDVTDAIIARLATKGGGAAATK